MKRSLCWSANLPQNHWIERRHDRSIREQKRENERDSQHPNFSSNGGKHHFVANAKVTNRIHCQWEEKHNKNEKRQEIYAICCGKQTKLFIILAVSRYTVTIDDISKTNNKSNNIRASSSKSSNSSNSNQIHIVVVRPSFQLNWISLKFIKQAFKLTKIIITLLLWLGLRSASAIASASARESYESIGDRECVSFGSKSRLWWLCSISSVLQRVGLLVELPVWQWAYCFNRFGDQSVQLWNECELSGVPVVNSKVLAIMEKTNDLCNERSVKTVATGDFHPAAPQTTKLNDFVPEKHNLIDDKADVTGCVHYKRRAKFVVCLLQFIFFFFSFSHIFFHLSSPSMLLPFPHLLVSLFFFSSHSFKSNLNSFEMTQNDTFRMM